MGGITHIVTRGYVLKKTCVVSNVIGNKDVIEDKYNGFICNNITDYITAISSNQNC